MRLLRLLLLSPLLLVVATPVAAEEWYEAPKPAVRKPVSPFERATLLINEGQFEAAIQEYMIAIQADPGNVEAHYRLGLLYQRLRRWDQAAHMAEKAYRLDNKHPDVMALWGHCLLRQGRHPESIWVLEGLIRLNAGRSMNGVYYDLAQACYGMKWYDRSVDYALRHLQSGETPQGHALLARTYLALGHKDKALGELQKAVQLYENVDDMLR
ncbi:MAG: tetratricopeptide repeat protein [Candidatus Sericytochromatia bacterium]